MLKHVTALDKEVLTTFCCDFLSNLEDEKLLTARTVCSDEAVLHVQGDVNRRNQQPHEATEHTRDGPNLNAFCISSNQIVFSPSSFSEHTVTATVCLMHILKETGPADVLFQTQEASSHFRKELMDLLNRKFPEKLVR